MNEHTRKLIGSAKVIDRILKVLQGCLFAVLLILSFIFRYGETLQQESDETL